MRNAGEMSWNGVDSSTVERGRNGGFMIAFEECFSFACCWANIMRLCIMYLLPSNTRPVKHERMDGDASACT